VSSQIAFLYIISYKKLIFPVAPYDSVTDLQPKVLGYSENLLTLKWSPAAANGLDTTYELYYLEFNPAVCESPTFAFLIVIKFYFIYFFNYRT
jgi:hypothetical protein